MRIYNTLSRKVEEFRPIAGKKVNFFVCGPTVYDFAHIGNAKTYTQFDFIIRYLRARGFDVFYLQNITDLDDKIIARAKEQGVTWRELSAKYEQIYLEDMKALHNLAVTEYARATDFIPQIVAQVKTLIAKGFAYRASDGIYYDIKKFADYGKLSGRTEADQNAGVSRIDESRDKKNKNDFCLWKFSSADEPSWETELGVGRPGWHIEDTAITESVLGSQYDIHGAAVDLIFPHHEAEIAQMEAASGKSPLVRVWMHAAFLNINAEKMSKSKGNIMTAREAVAKYGYRLLRFFFISAHYRTPLDFGDDTLAQAGGALKRLDDFVAHLDEKLEDGSVGELRTKVEGFLDDDFDTPKALAAIFDFIREQNARGPGGKNVAAYFKELNEIFDFMDFGGKSVPQEVEKLLAKRDELRKSGDYAQADKIRQEIIKMGYTVEDDATRYST
ncbi:cysteine--tRNA ligase [Candidatus Microgenomates bacterium]|nr:cysteine--tRNA ligase [Candidatus Microgenomates bacterium]